MQVELTLEEKSAAAILAAGELAAIKAEQLEAGQLPDMAEVTTLLGLCNKCRPEGTEEVTWEMVQPLEPDDDDEPGDQPVESHLPIT